MSINKYHENWLDVLNLQLSDLRHKFPDAHIYALVEGVLNESCYPLLKRSVNLPHAALYADLPGADTETLCISPLLVEYAETGKRTWDAILKKTDGQPALSLIVTPESLVQLTARLAPWCVVSADDYTVGLSFADTRILPELIKVLTSKQLDQFCGPALLWQYVTRDAQWFTLPLTGYVAEPSLAVSLDAQQCSRLMAAAEADNVLFQLRTTAPNLLDCYTSAHAHSLVQYWLTFANHAQLGAGPERVGLCELGLTYPAMEHDSQTAAWLEMPSKPYTFDALRTQLHDMFRIL